MREVFSQTPPGEKEAALALGSSRWRMIRRVVIPFGRGGIVGGSMLALGRAMGESISVAILLSAAFRISPHILETGGNTIGAHIVNRFGDADTKYGLPALMGAGLVLYASTLLVNVGASEIIRRSRSGAGVEI
jgi:phosphate transport system permease protein